jgi:hypothetical protein
MSPFGRNVPRWMEWKQKALPARSSRPSHGEGEGGFFTY